MNFNDPFSHGAYLLWDGGSLKFDIVESEEVERDGEVTEHPVETGANIADHFRVKLTNIKFEAFVSQEPVDPTLYPDMAGALQGVELALPPYPPAGIMAAGIANPLSLLNTPPTNFVQQALVYANPIDTLAYVLGVLEGLRQNATLVDVATRSWYYAQFLVTNVTTKRDEHTGTGASISLSLRQVLTVTTDAVAAPPTPVQKKDYKINLAGKFATLPAPPQSMAAKLVDAATGTSQTPIFVPLEWGLAAPNF